MTDQFQNRHIGSDENKRRELLDAIEVKTLDDLINQTVPQSIRLGKELDLPEALSEYEYLKQLKQISQKNQVFKSYIGLGYNPTITPTVIQRNILENPGWYTQYTPYQAEIAQGRLEALLNFQTVISDLTGLEIANASLLDEGTAAAEAMIMFYNALNKGKSVRTKFFVDENCFPQTLDILKTRATPLGIELVIGDYKTIELNETFFGTLAQYPNADGAIIDYTEFIEKTHQIGAYATIAADLLSLAILKSPAEMRADAAVGSSQRFGIPMGYGGPHAAFFATTDQFKRNIPGRIIGISVDVDNNPAYRMALQTREQHIRREKATSNICTAQALLAIMAGMYAAYHGPIGIRNIANSIHQSANTLASLLEKIGFSQKNKVFFDTLKLEDNGLSEKIKRLAEAKQVNFRYINGHIGISINETTNLEDIEEIASIFSEANGNHKATQGLITTPNIPTDLQRKSDYLTHPVFNMHHSETQMMRYIKSLENKDLSLTHSMISLGSCTMKLNAASELIPISWAEFNQLHPYAPINQTGGYQQIFTELENYLSEITGFAATSLQPNSGAQGEYAGLMVIRAYHEANGNSHRNIVLIPSSAHGTNPASAVMAGMQVVIVKCNELGNIDVADLQEKAEKYKDNLGALMVTYPSTHGVFEKAIKEICTTIHENGGQVYMDGANMNAQVGLTSPACIGADVCHLNLHKTFSIPHGGGGPGVGTISVASQLAPFLPGNPILKTGGENAISSISAAPWGSASILLISYGYIKMLGKEGVTNSTKNAILNANYLKSKLENHYPVLYVGENGRVAHEFIIDLRQFKHSIGIEAEDVAKRLIDYGFHAPTVSFPVAGTMMIEPTESEDKAELDRFAEAMIAIRQEIQEIEDEVADPANNVLKNAPHTVAMVTTSEWKLPYSREKAVFPINFVKEHKFWPAVRRINNTHGDRNLICVCPPIKAYEEEVLA